MNAGAEPLLRLQGLTKRFGDVQALDSVELDIHAGQVHCLLGENGAGKSTLCNLIFGVYAPSAGCMTFKGAAHAPQNPGQAIASGIAMVHQHFSLVHDMTVVENMLLGQKRGWLDRHAARQNIQRVGAEFGLALDPDRLISRLSVGERQRVEIVKCLIHQPDLVVLDEPTAVLPPGEIDALLALIKRMAGKGCAVVLVTHKLAEIAEVAQHCTVMRTGRVVQSTAMADTSIDVLIRAMVGRDVTSLSHPSKTAQNEIFEANNADKVRDVLQIDDLSLIDSHGRLQLEKVTLNVKPGEIVGIAGVEGNGQSELALVLAGLLKPTEGRVFVHKTDLTGRAPRDMTAAGVGVVPEDRHATGCITAMSVADNLLLAKLPEFTRYGLLRRVAMHQEALQLMQKFDVRAASPDVPFSSLSGGNQQKAVLARELTLPNLTFLVAAHPTRGLDIGAVERVYQHIREAAANGVAVLLISSELDELLQVCNRIVVMYRGRIAGAMPAAMHNRNAIGALMSGQAA